LHFRPFDDPCDEEGCDAKNCVPNFWDARFDSISFARIFDAWRRCPSDFFPEQLLLKVFLRRGTDDGQGPIFKA
jgi:hypothetical protein